MCLVCVKDEVDQLSKLSKWKSSDRSYLKPDPMGDRDSGIQSHRNENYQRYTTLFAFRQTFYENHPYKQDYHHSQVDMFPRLKNDKVTRCPASPCWLRAAWLKRDNM